MVHTLFTWPYGGRQVYLSLACNGWTDRRQMSLVEGSSTIFQVVLDLPPGCYEYKFLVDGVWRCNDQDESGRINNVILINEPEISSRASQDQRFTPSMDIDGSSYASEDMASSSNVPHLTPELQLLDSDRETSCRRLCEFLSTHQMYELMPVSGKVFALDVEVAVKEAFYVMYKQELAAVPIWDSNRRQISGMMTASDFILILMELHRNRVMLSNEQLEMHSIATWKEGKHRLCGESFGSPELIFRRPLIRADPDESLKDVAVRIMQNKISTIPVIYSTTEEGACPQLLHIACLGGILRHICRHFRNRLDYLPVLQQSIGSIGLGKWSDSGASDRLLTLRPSESLMSALNLLVKAQISSIPVVDQEGSLLDVYSRSDITSLAKEDAYARVRLEQTTLSQALELVDGPRYRTCTRFDSLYVAMERLSNPVVRRLVVIEVGTRKVEGIITLSDIFTFILS